MKRRNRLNWYVLLGCMLLLAAGGTLCGLGAFVLAGNAMVHPASYFIALVLCAGFYAAAWNAIILMERA